MVFSVCPLPLSCFGRGANLSTDPPPHLRCALVHQIPVRIFSFWNETSSYVIGQTRPTIRPLPPHWHPRDLQSIPNLGRPRSLPEHDLYIPRNIPLYVFPLLLIGPLHNILTAVQS